jgi:hypothetical protein
LCPSIILSWINRAVVSSFMATTISFTQPQTPGKVTKPTASIAALRKTMARIDRDPALGIVARMDFMCCNTCAGEAMCREMKKHKKNGAVFWHQQGYQGRRVWLGFGVRENDGERDCDEEMVKVGKTVVAELEADGITSITWDGTADTKIRVDVDEPQDDSDDDCSLAWGDDDSDDE